MTEPVTTPLRGESRKTTASAISSGRPRVPIGWTETEGEAVTQKQFHDAPDDWAEQAAARQPMGTLGRPEEIADAVVFLSLIHI